MAAHRDRYSTTGVTLRKEGVVIHDSETGDGSARNLIAAMQRPGDRLIAGSNPPRYYGSGYHAIALNVDDDFEQLLGAEAGPFHAPPLNKTWWSICIPGRANQTRDEWLDEESHAGIRAVARFIVEKAKADGFPLERVDAAGLKAGRRGYTSHWEVSKAFGQTDHTDPGANFPWDVLADEIRRLTTQIPTPTTPTIEELIMSGSFSIIAVHSSGAKAFLAKGPAGTEMTGVPDADIPAVQAGFAAANGGAALPVLGISDQLWDACFADALISKGYATGGRNSSGAFAVAVNHVGG